MSGLFKKLLSLRLPLVFYYEKYQDIHKSEEHLSGPCMVPSSGSVITSTMQTFPLRPLRASQCNFQRDRLLKTHDAR